LSKQENEMFLKETIQEMDGMKKIMSDLVNAWKAGDTRNLHSQVVGEMQKFPTLYKKFLTDRNRSWAPKVENFLKEDKDVFVVVGAAHLLGSEGVVELLRAKGYKIQQM
jgi:uncharacterized protein